ncbi:hypothetical protein EYS14_00930 [Alteromonadaceae bacterium M269]|nr:hypothetical protein EYS14_00930 [Alteromonadaceae bacterium M269]
MQNINKLGTLSSALLIAAISNSVVGQANAQGFRHKLQGTVQINYVDAANETSFLEGGISPFRYDNQDSNVHLGQLHLNYRANLSSAFSVSVDANHYDDLDHTPDITQATIRYAPLPINGYRLRVKAGTFIPALSIENTKPGWLSNVSYSSSAVNTWIGEELKSSGIEASFTRPGRRFRSPWSWTINGSVFKGNDTAGTLLAFRGWAIHDRVLGLNEEIPLANLPGFNGPSGLSMHTRSADLIEEIDGRWGFSAGAQVKYLSRLDVRFTRYDNNGDAIARDFREEQWAWDTKFNHVAVRYGISPKTTFLSQFLRGTTEAGNGWLVKLDFEAYYVGITHKEGDHQFSLRYDNFSATDLDGTPMSDNDSAGKSWTAFYQYEASDQVSLGIEFISVSDSAQHRLALSGVADATQEQITAGLTYRF